MLKVNNFIEDMKYEEFITKKLGTSKPTGINVPLLDYDLFPHQRDLTSWALKRGRAAIFADTGLGKSRMQLAWADMIHRHTGMDILILAPLAVAEQTVEEGESIDVYVNHARENADIKKGINITNYDRLHKFDTSRFGAVVLDESSIIKHHSAKTLQTLLNCFADTPYKLCATATPAPNDWTELGTHAEFLGIRSRAEMLAEFFVHDGGETQTWRLKGHAKKVFWKWVSSWGAMVRSPSDLGYDASNYELPPLNINHHEIELEHDFMDGLFVMEAQTLMDRRRARRNSLSERVKAAADIINATDQTWIVWCDLNDEGNALTDSIHGAVQITGSDDAKVKEHHLHSFSHGNIKVLVSKPSICGFGLNWQHCHNMAFVGVTDSYESYYQAVRRCWRFGQKHPVNVHIFSSPQEGAVLKNLIRKEADAKVMSDFLAAETHEALLENIYGATKETNLYDPLLHIKLPKFMQALYELH